MSPRLSKTYSFGPFRLESDERRLLRGGELVPLGGKAFDLLELLLEGAGKLQKQQALMDRLWPDTVVEQNNLQHQVSQIRRALPGVEIETVRGHGYRLLADVQVQRSAANAPRVFTPGETSFAKAHDGARIAYARVGDGPPIVKAANWLSRLDADQDEQVWAHWLEFLNRDRCLVRYDARGNGLSDWEAPSISFDDFVADLAAVFDAAGIERAPLVGVSQGATVAARFAARYPERVSALVLVGGFARGWRAKQHAGLCEQFESLMVLMRHGWGGENPAFRQIFTTAILPGASAEQFASFNALQRKTASPENAVRIMSALGEADVRADLDRVTAPTLVCHSRGDACVPIKDGMELASGIRGARFVPLDSANHLLLAGEPAWDQLQREIRVFLASAGV